MSLLATATYLSVPSVAHLAITTIISAINVENVLIYLQYALGSPIENVESMDDPAAGLTSVAHLVSSSTSIISERSCSIYTDAASTTDGDEEKHNGPPLESTHYYGVLSDRLGHACACWLAKWGTDMIDMENGLDSGTVPRIWRRGGLTPSWVHALISSDFFFVKSEWNRYEYAKRVVELRRRESISQEEETVWKSLFESGILYEHMVLFYAHAEATLIKQCSPLSNCVKSLPTYPRRLQKTMCSLQ